MACLAVLFGGGVRQGAAEPVSAPRAVPLEDTPRTDTRERMLEDVARSWKQPGVTAAVPGGPTEDMSTAFVRRKLAEIMVPAVQWTRVPIGDVAWSLSTIAEEFDPAPPGPARGVNVVLVDPDGAAPLVTLTLRHASLKRVLDFLVESIGYTYEVQADAVVIRPGGESGPLETAVLPISRATVLRMAGQAGAPPPPSTGQGGISPGFAPLEDAAKIRAFLERAGIPFDRAGTSLAYDGAAVIVTQSPRHLERLRQLLRRYRETRQVEIEAKFMEVQDGALEEFGVAWNLSRRGLPQLVPGTGEPVLDAHGRPVLSPQENYTTQSVTRSLNGAFSPSTNQNLITISDGTTGIKLPVAPAQIPGGVQLGAVAGPLGTISGMIGEFDVNAAVRALSQRQGTDLLSSPRVTVLSGSSATITVAQEFRYPQSFGEIQSQVGSGAASGATGISSAGVTITSGTPQEFTTRNVGVELTVSPTVEEDDHSIALELNPRVTEFEGFVEYGGPSIAISSGVTVTVPPGFYQPIFSVRDISTRVTLWDGATLVMGGLTREEVKQVNDKVPVLGDIPLLGRLFRSKGESAQKRNLLIFVTASVVNPGGARRVRPGAESTVPLQDGDP